LIPPPQILHNLLANRLSLPLWPKCDYFKNIQKNMSGLLAVLAVDLSNNRLLKTTDLKNNRFEKYHILENKIFQKQQQI
jgi:hypothetical protein